MAGFIQVPFTVEVIRFDPAAYTIAVKTAPGVFPWGHPLLGYRYWRTFKQGAFLFVETGSLDRPALEWDNTIQGWRWLGFDVDRWGSGDQLKIWKEYLDHILHTLASEGDGIQVSSEGENRGLPDLYRGRWGWMDKIYILDQVCGPRPSAVALMCQ